MRQWQSRTWRARGLTLVELMIVVAVVAVLVVLAAPSFRDLILVQRLKSIHAQLVTDLQYARSEAVSSGAVVNVRVQPQLFGVPHTCYIIFHHFSRDYLNSGASSACDCREPAGSRCTLADTRELRTVQVPLDGGVTLAPGQVTQAVAFDPKTGGMMLKANELGLGTGQPFMVTSAIDPARSLSAVVGLSGRPRICRLPGSTLPDPAC
ncbi:MAG: GspH/FimT family pseudopilin [Rubrivivax sp.]|nr:GspH/FimT family pseudopilin [Rubrivivax sp.]